MDLLFLLIPIILICIVVGVIIYVKGQARRISRQLFQTDSLIEGYQQQKQLLSETPKSVSGMTRIYLPQIARDFPEFHYEEFKTKAEQMLLSAFQAITQENADLLEHASGDLKSAVSLQIEGNQVEGKTEHYSQITLHQTEITGYQKIGGTCTITLQSAVGHLYYAQRDGTVVAGDKELKEQCRYNIDIVYIQDASKLSASDQTAFASSVCPNCGAPVADMGNKFCAYCGSSIQSVNIRVWNINQFEKL